MKFDTLPTWGETIHAVEDDKIVFLATGHDCAADNPLDDGCWGEIVSLSRRHATHDAARFASNCKDPDCVILGYFEHGECLWHVSGCTPSGTEGDYRWDGVSVAGLWIPDAAQKRELEFLGAYKVRRSTAERWAADACRVFTEWCNSRVFEWRLEMYPVRITGGGVVYDALRDYRFEEPLEIETCGNVYLPDSESEKFCLDEINGIVSSWLNTTPSTDDGY